ncbi:YczE/YyaS/YitT family protein [Lacrimispora sp. 38-1]|uniref:YczE/YyaS/YitT family protein n=1 Tax=Lacrimispora sp. 38-1 TaxID=3125778 RepID=UPI003CF3100F
MTKKNSQLIAYSILSFVFFGFGVSLQLKAAIGQSVLNALAVTLSYLIPWKVGTILNMINTIFFISYLLFRRTRLNYKDIIQIIATIGNGIIINFFLYQVLSGFTAESYLFKLLLYITGLIIASLSLGAVLAIGIIRFPLESLCLTITELFHRNFTAVRMSFDVIFLAVTIALTLWARTPLQIREGTVISVILLSPLLGICYDFFKKHWNMED